MGRLFGARDHRRRLVASISALFLIVTLGQPAVVAAQAADATPAAGATPAAEIPELGIPTGIDVDLGAMVLLPEEVDREFASASGALLDAERAASILAADLGYTPEEFVEELEDAGFVARYVYYGGVLDEDDPSLYARSGASYVTLYEDSDGAEAGFELVEDEPSDSGAEDIEDAPKVGDQSELTRIEGTASDTDAEFMTLDYTFRIDNLVGGISITAYDGSEPDEDEIAELAEQQLERIEAVLDGESPGLFLPAMRVESSNDLFLYASYEEYDLIDGNVPIYLNEAEADYDQRAEYWTDAGMEAVYRTDAYLLPEGEDDVNTSLAVVTHIYRFASDDEAEAFAEDAAAEFIDTSGELYADIKELDDLLSSFDGAASGLSYEVDLAEDATAAGVRYWVQDGADVVSVQSDIDGGVTEEGVVALVAEQPACLEEPEEQCSPVSLPDDLLD